MKEHLEIKGVIAGIIFFALVLFLINSIFTEKYTEAMVFAIVTFTMYFAASGKLKKFKGFGLELEFLKEKPIVQQDEKIILPLVEGGDEMLGEKGNPAHLRENILPNMNNERYTTLAVRHEIMLYRPIITEYLEKLLSFDFFEHVVFLDDARKFRAHIDAKKLYLILLSNTDNQQHEEQANKTISLINNRKLSDIPEIVHDSIVVGTNYFEALQLMKKTGNKYLPIVDDSKQFKGILTKEEVLDEIVKASKLKIPSTV